MQSDCGFVPFLYDLIGNDRSSKQRKSDFAMYFCHFLVGDQAGLLRAFFKDVLDDIAIHDSAIACLQLF